MMEDEEVKKRQIEMTERLMERAVRDLCTKKATSAVEAFDEEFPDDGS